MACVCLFTIFFTLIPTFYAFTKAATAFELLGLCFLLYYTSRLLMFIFKAIYVFNLAGKQDFKKKYGQWAIVTGCTDGIGKAFATELSKKYNMKIVLISRTLSKLEDLAKELPTDCKVIAADLSKLDENNYDKIQDVIRDLDIGILVNNVGVGYDHPDYFTTITKNEINNLISLNCFPQARLTNMVIDGMENRRRGLVISLSSFSAVYPMPLLSLYSACKEFNRYLSEALNRESKFVKFQTIQPYFVTTKLSKIRRPSFLIPTPKTFVNDALKTSGFYSTTPGCFSQHIYCNLCEFMVSTPGLNYVMQKVTWSHLIGTRNRFYKKIERMNKEGTAKDK